MREREREREGERESLTSRESEREREFLTKRFMFRIFTSFVYLIFIKSLSIYRFPLFRLCRFSGREREKAGIHPHLEHFLFTERGTVEQFKDYVMVKRGDSGYRGERPRESVLIEVAVDRKNTL